MNIVELTGRVTQPVELKETSNGTAVTTINLAVKQDFVKKDEEPKPDFIPVTVWSKLAEVCADHLCKGYLVGITGRLQRRTYDTAEGERRYVTEVVADKVEFLSKPKENTESSDIKESKKSKSKKAS
jgi:single-strand DNA-binding protein